MDEKLRKKIESCLKDEHDKCAKSCWDFWNCPSEYRDKCPAYIHEMGDECWLIVGSFVNEPTCPLVKDEFKSCLECPWFRLKHPKTEDLSEFIE